MPDAKFHCRREPHLSDESVVWKDNFQCQFPLFIIISTDFIDFSFVGIFVTNSDL